MKISKNQLLNEIRMTSANLSEIAAKYDMTYGGLWKRINANETLLAEVNEARERLLDVAQSRLADAVRAGEPWALKFLLSTWGRGRGFSKTVVVESESPKGVLHFYFPDDGRDKPDPSNPPECIEQIAGDEIPPMKSLDESNEGNSDE